MVQAEAEVFDKDVLDFGYLSQAFLAYINGIAFRFQFFFSFCGYVVAGMVACHQHEGL